MGGGGERERSEGSSQLNTRKGAKRESVEESEGEAGIAAKRRRMRKNQRVRLAGSLGPITHG